MFEGIDGTGKTTLAKATVASLDQAGLTTEYMAFPERSSQIGQVINDYLQGNIEVNPQAMCLLFAANRWEKSEHIKTKLEEGVSLVIDRYTPSAIAYSCATGLNDSWCKSLDDGLPLADIVLYLTASTDAYTNRDIPRERYESEGFLNQVKKYYDQLKNERWITVETMSMSIEDTTTKIIGILEQALFSSN